MSMTKIDIVNSVYENLDISKKDSIRIVESVFEYGQRAFYCAEFGEKVWGGLCENKLR